jgi:putative FmdB family regulatory protein
LAHIWDYFPKFEICQDMLDRWELTGLAGTQKTVAPSTMHLSIICGLPFAPTVPESTPMPIYAYRCETCGHAKDVLQKISDPVLTTCPACGAEAFKKQVTAAGFQLKGSGWYVTDFRGSTSGAPADKADKAGDTATTPAADTKSADPAPAATSASAPSTASTTPGPTPASAATASPPKAA